MLIIGNQLKAARALAGVDQQTLADVAGVHVNTIRKMESKGTAEITSAADLVRRVQRAMEQLGVEFTNDGQPGVRLAAVVHEPVARKKEGAGLGPPRKKNGRRRMTGFELPSAWPAC
jgi:transcriptional regulator with XRE-family HTH domain